MPAMLRSHNNRRQVVPAVLQPAPAEWDDLSPANRGALARLLGEPAEYVDHARFHQPDAEHELFATNPCDGGQTDPSTELTRVHTVAGRRLVLRSAVNLFLKYNYARMRVAQLLEQYSGQRMPPSVIHELLVWNRRATAIRDQIVEGNLGLVPAMLRYCWQRNADRDALISEGNLSLFRCVGRFDCSIGCRFSTYAGSAILKSIRCLAERTTRRQQRFGLSCDPAMEAVGSRPGRDEEAESNALGQLRLILAGDQPLLTSAEQQVIRARYLRARASGDRRPTCLTIGAAMGFSRERIRRIQIKALRKLRSALNKRLSA